MSLAEYMIDELVEQRNMARKEVALLRKLLWEARENGTSGDWALEVDKYFDTGEQDGH